jgi:acetyl-CoA carboxylase biotin carboxyl carrier protein
MAENPSSPAGPLDVQRIHYLVRLMKRYDLTALDISDGQIQVRLRRRGPETGPAAVAWQSEAVVSSPAQPVSSSPPPASPRTDQPAVAAPAAPKTILIESPMVGTYYASSAPEAPPFVSTGSFVHPSTIVGIIEAMKVFTDIPAGVSGTITEVLVKNGQAVEFGQPMFRVIPG